MNYGFIGTGLMGGPMVERLLNNGIKPIIYNRTRAKTDALAVAGAIVADSPDEVIAKSDTIIFMLSNFYAVSETMFPSKKTDYFGKTVLQMSTIAPGENIILAERVVKNGGEYIEAPVLGSIPQIKAGELITIFGGSEEQFSKWESFFKNFGEKVIYSGKLGSASSIKLSLNHLIASLTAAFSLSLGYLREQNIDHNIFMNILRSSALYAPTFDKKLDNMLSGNFNNPNFPLKHLLKDVKLMLHEFDHAGLNTPQLKGVEEVIQNALAQGLAEKDYSSLYNGVHEK